MNIITIFFILKSLDLIINVLKKEQIPEKILNQIIDKIDKIESLLYKDK